MTAHPEAICYPIAKCAGAAVFIDRMHGNGGDVMGDLFVIGDLESMGDCFVGVNRARHTSERRDGVDQQYYRPTSRAPDGNAAVRQTNDGNDTSNASYQAE